MSKNELLNILHTQASVKDAHEFQPLLAEIEDTPTNPLGHLVFWVVSALVVILIAWLTIGKIDVVVTARGKVVPVGQVKVVESLNPGVVKKLYTEPGDHVKAGQVIVEIEPETVEPEYLASLGKQQYTQDEIQRIESLLGNPSAPPETITQQELYMATESNYEEEKSRIRAEMAQVGEQKAATLVSLKRAKDLLSTSEDKLQRLLSVSDIVAKNTLQDAEEEALKNRSTVDELKHRMAELDHRNRELGSQLNALGQSYRRTLLTELSEKQKSFMELQAESTVKGFQTQLQRIKAPVSGVVDEQFVHASGEVVSPDTKILTLVPDAVPLQLEVNVRSRDNGYLKPNMPVRVKLDTFEYQKFGTLDGTLVKVLPDSFPADPTQQKTAGNGESFYKAFIKLKQRTIKVHGKDETITPGMTVTTEIIVGKRRIIEFFIYPLISALQESLSLR